MTVARLRSSLPLTRAGWLMVAGSLVTIVVGRLLGILELTLLGVGGIVLVLAAVVLTLGTPTSLFVHRVVSSGRAVAGDSVDVRIEVEHRGRRATPELELVDRVGRREAHLLAPPLAPGGSCEASYVLPTPRRGRLRLGPIDVVAADPFGLSRRAVPKPVTAEVLVVPRIVPLRPLPRVPVEDTGGASTGPRRLTTGAGEFHSLRPYVFGDDLRMVHWASAMRTGNLVVRQNEQLWDSVTTVVLDDRAGVHGSDTFEDAVTAAASIAAAAQRGGARFRLLTVGGHDTGLSAGPAHLDRVLHSLALVEADSPASLSSLAATLDRRTAGAVALVVGRLDGPATTGVRHVLGTAGAAIVVTTDPRSAPQSARVPVVPTGPHLTRDWAAAIERLRAARLAG